MESHASVIIPFDDRVLFDAVSGIQFLVGGRRLGERRPLGTVCVRRSAGI
jgi:hypothetical protein